MLVFGGLGKILIAAGVFLLVFGLLIALWSKIPFLGRLPGDIVIQKDGFHLFFPLVTSIVISLVLTFLLNVVLRILR